MGSFSKWTVGELKAYLQNIDDDINVVLFTEGGECNIISVYVNENSLVIEEV